MNKFVVFSDVDGTLLDSNNKILNSTLYSINELKKKDIDFLIVIKTIVYKYLRINILYNKY